MKEVFFSCTVNTRLTEKTVLQKGFTDTSSLQRFMNHREASTSHSEESVHTWIQSQPQRQGQRIPQNFVGDIINHIVLFFCNTNVLHHIKKKRCQFCNTANCDSWWTDLKSAKNEEKETKVWFLLNRSGGPLCLWDGGDRIRDVSLLWAVLTVEPPEAQDGDSYQKSALLQFDFGSGHRESDRPLITSLTPISY